MAIIAMYGIVFFGTPHRGMESQDLRVMVEGLSSSASQSSNTVIEAELL
jgi:hypothetical protein